jgi:hypothetical protein
MCCLCVNVYCTTATSCQPNGSYQIYYHIGAFLLGGKDARDVKFITSIWWEAKISWNYTTALGFQKKS